MKINQTQNEILAEIVELTAEIKERTARLEELKAYCKAKGSFSTRDYVCAITESLRWTIGPMDEILKFFSKDDLVRKNILRLSRVHSVRVTPRGPVVDLDV